MVVVVLVVVVASGDEVGLMEDSEEAEVDLTPSREGSNFSNTDPLTMCVLYQCTLTLPLTSCIATTA